MFGVIISIMAATTTFLCGNKKFGLRAGFRPPFSGNSNMWMVYAIIILICGWYML